MCPIDQRFPQRPTRGSRCRQPSLASRSETRNRNIDPYRDFHAIAISTWFAYERGHNTRKYPLKVRPRRMPRRGSRPAAQRNRDAAKYRSPRAATIRPDRLRLENPRETNAIITPIGGQTRIRQKAFRQYAKLSCHFRKGKTQRRTRSSPRSIPKRTREGLVLLDSFRLVALTASVHQRPLRIPGGRLVQRVLDRHASWRRLSPYDRCHRFSCLATASATSARASSRAAPRARCSSYPVCTCRM